MGLKLLEKRFGLPTWLTKAVAVATSWFDCSQAAVMAVGALKGGVVLVLGMGELLA